MSKTSSGGTSPTTRVKAPISSAQGMLRPPKGAALVNLYGFGSYQGDYY